MRRQARGSPGVEIGLPCDRHVERFQPRRGLQQQRGSVLAARGEGEQVSGEDRGPVGGLPDLGEVLARLRGERALVQQQGDAVALRPLMVFTRGLAAVPLPVNNQN